MVNEKQNERKETSGLKNKVLAVVVGTTLLTGCRGLKYNPNWGNETRVEIHNYQNYDPYARHQGNGYTIKTGPLFKSDD